MYSGPLRVQPAVTYREAIALGVPRGTQFGPGWLRPHRDVRLPAGADLDLPLQRALAVAALLPHGAALGGWAAATVLGCAGPDGRGADGRSALPVPVVTPPPLQMRRRDGLVLWRSPLEPDDVVEVNGIPVTAPLRTAFDCARRSPLAEAVVALDALAATCALDLADVGRYIASRRGWGGVPLARAALALADPRSRSAGESRLRVFWMLEAGLPRPEVNVRVLDPDGHLVGIVDLLDPERALIGEYDGEHHRTALQHADDNAREEWLEHLGLVVARFGGLDLRAGRRARSRLRLQAAAARGLARDRTRDKWSWQV